MHRTGIDRAVRRRLRRSRFGRFVLIFFRIGHEFAPATAAAKHIIATLVLVMMPAVGRVNRHPANRIGCRRHVLAVRLRRILHVTSRLKQIPHGGI